MEQNRRRFDEWKQRSGLTEKPGQILSIAAAAVSLAAAGMALAFENLPAALVGVYGFLLLLSLLHESGHLIGCALSGHRIKELRFFTFSISKNGVHLRTDRSMKHSCVFTGPRNDLAVYAGGPAASFLVSCLMAALYIRTKHAVVCLYGMVSVLHLLGNIIPHGKNDMQCILACMKERSRTKP